MARRTCDIGGCPESINAADAEGTGWLLSLDMDLCPTHAEMATEISPKPSFGKPEEPGVFANPTLTQGGIFDSREQSRKSAALLGRPVNGIFEEDVQGITAGRGFQVQCDHFDCQSRGRFANNWQDARQFAANEGWLIEDDKDLCPAHRLDPERETFSDELFSDELKLIEPEAIEAPRVSWLGRIWRFLRKLFGVSEASAPSEVSSLCEIEGDEHSVGQYLEEYSGLVTSPVVGDPGLVAGIVEANKPPSAAAWSYDWLISAIEQGAQLAKKYEYGDLAQIKYAKQFVLMEPGLTLMKLGEVSAICDEGKLPAGDLERGVFRELRQFFSEAKDRSTQLHLREIAQFWSDTSEIYRGAIRRCASLEEAVFLEFTKDKSLEQVRGRMALLPDNEQDFSARLKEFGMPVGLERLAYKTLRYYAIRSEPPPFAYVLSFPRRVDLGQGSCLDSAAIHLVAQEWCNMLRSGATTEQLISGVEYEYEGATEQLQAFAGMLESGYRIYDVVQNGGYVLEISASERQAMQSVIDWIKAR